MKQYEVYCHTNTLNNKSYIGYTSQSTLTRLQKHILNANYGIQSHFYRAIRKYGIEVFSTKILFKTDILEEALEMEKYYIKEYDSIVNGYNMTSGGTGGNTQIGFDDEKMEQYLNDLSNRTSSEKNPNHSGKTDDEIVDFYYNLYMENMNWLSRPFMLKAKENGIPQSFSKCRFNGLGWTELRKRILEKVQITNPEIKEIKYIRTKEHIEKLSGTQFKKGIKWNEQPQNKKNKGGNTN